MIQLLYNYNVRLTDAAVSPSAPRGSCSLSSEYSPGTITAPAVALMWDAKA